MTTAQFLAEWALRSAILIVTGALLLWLLRVKDSSIRLAAWTSLLCGSLAIPPLTATLPKMPLAILSARSLAADALAVPYEPAQATLRATSRPANRVAANDPGVSSRLDWPLAGLIIYTIIAGALLLRVCLGLAMALRLLRGSRVTGQVSNGIEIRESDQITSPVALGIARPAIVLPADWREWDAAKLDAVLAHERSHIRRHDPVVQLFSAIHRALLWHSPLSWVLHQRIVRVAEEASDDAAVAATSDRASYAKVLLDFIERGVRGTSWQGVPMARYDRPEERIHRVLDGVHFSRGVTRWGLTAILALASPLAYVVAAADPQAGPQTADKHFSFDAASVKPSAPLSGTTMSGAGGGGAVTTARKQAGGRRSGGPGTDDPGRIHYPHTRLKDLIVEAYDVAHFQVQGPNWLDEEGFDIDATMPPQTTKAQFHIMLRNLMVERFKMAVHRETKELPGYALAVAKNGPKLNEAARIAAPRADDTPQRRAETTDRYGLPLISPNAIPGRAGLTFWRGPGGDRLYCQQQTMHDLANELQNRFRQPVMDATGLTASYDFLLTFTHNLPEGQPAPPGVEWAPDLLVALQAQLGLKLDSRKVPTEVIVIDHMEKTPTQN